MLGLGAGEAFVFDAATFVISAVLLSRVRPRRASAGPTRQSVVHELRVGWREVRSRPWVWATIAAFAGAVLCAYAQWYALAPRLTGDLYGSVGLFGVLESVAGAGAVAGALAGIRWRPRRPIVTGLMLALAGPLAAAFGARTVLGIGSVLAFARLGLALLPRSTRELTGERRASAEQLARDVGVERAGEPEIAHVDPLVGAVHQGRGF